MSIDLNTILTLLEQGENAYVEFKADAVRPESVAREIVAFANTFGGTLMIGVEDDGSLSGIESDRETWGKILDTGRLN